MTKATIHIGMFGFGNVGMGVLNILTHHNDMLAKRTGKRLVVKSVVVRELSKARAMKLPGIMLSDDPDLILGDPDIQIVVEAMGGEYPAYDYIKRALQSGKFVVTANKEVVSKHKKEFFELAKANKTDIYFEASVGGGIPLIRSLKVGFAANRITALYGIVNGTTNFILSQIAVHNKEFDVALKEAQRLGFAEADPHMDISGLDTAYKLSILAAVAFKADVKVQDFYYEGIEAIALKDIQYARELGYAIKLLAIGYRLGDEDMVFKVHPTMIPHEHPLAAVDNELNAVYIVGDSVGESMLSGRGAGGSPTGSAIVSDIMDIAFDTRVAVKRDALGAPHTVIEGVDESLYITKRNLEDDIETVPVVGIEDTFSQFYFRLSLTDTRGALAKVATLLSDHDVSISKLIQKDPEDNLAEVVVVTHKVKEANVRQFLTKAKALDSVKAVKAMIRVGLEEV